MASKLEAKPDIFKIDKAESKNATAAVYLRFFYKYE